MELYYAALCATQETELVEFRKPSEAIQFFCAKYGARLVAVFRKDGDKRRPVYCA